MGTLMAVLVGLAAGAGLIVAALVATVLMYRVDGVDLVKAIKWKGNRGQGLSAPTSPEGETVSEREGEYEGPEGDDLHQSDGSHWDEPPAGSNPLTWKRRMRLHLEGHRTDAMVRNVAPGLFIRPRRPST